MEFVKGWHIIQTLGEGSYGEVKLLSNQDTGYLVAMKAIDHSKHAETTDLVRKEISIHRMLKQDNIVAFLGSREHKNVTYIFLEYMARGELFDRIEPDIGMSSANAFKFFRQLIAGVEYLHSRGVTHRDLKPENLLLDSNDTLKITDLGLATVFRFRGKERLLTKRCGTLPYVAPEVLHRPYAAEPADVWSCGIILVAMLAGELPWDKADPGECKEFKQWKMGDYVTLSPWSKVDPLNLSLLRRVLAVLPSERLRLAEIKCHRSLRVPSTHTRPESGLDDVDGVAGARLAKLRQQLQEGPLCLSEDLMPEDTHMLYSQPALSASLSPTGLDQKRQPHFPFSQPTKPQHLILSTQTLTQPGSENLLSKLVKRMTRFTVSLSLQSATAKLTQVLHDLSLGCRISSPPLSVTVETVDRRRTRLVFRACLHQLDTDHASTLMDFRLSSGCGLEFKRHFISIKASLKPFILQPN